MTFSMKNDNHVLRFNLNKNKIYVSSSVHSNQLILNRFLKKFLYTYV